MFKLPVIVALVLMLIGPQAWAVDYQLPDLNGKMQSLEQYRGKWLVVNYWATWCKTCRKELPDLVSMHNDSQDQDIVVVGINFESINPAELKTFVEQHRINYPVLLSMPVPATPLGRVFALPTTYIIDPNGKLVAGQVGLVSQQNLLDYINQKRMSDAYAVIASP
ncbi:MAG: TlpA family protein disulfide reductase [Gammaproteobacteria bacterium]|nr:TlpA family protein disulfide reductase [Gammaproteobacteria bacterium]